MQTALPGGTVLKQRWNTQMLPSRATCTRMTSPQRPPFMLCGMVGHPSTSRYGLGRSVGLGYWVWAFGVNPNATMTAALVRSGNTARRARNILALPLKRWFPNFSSQAGFFYTGRLLRGHSLETHMLARN